VEGIRTQLTDPPDDLDHDVAAFIEDLAARDLLTLEPAEN
jgi:hypothetical protein